jgi:hypothetical protein
MLKIYVPESGLDWMNYKIVRENVAFHHIVKKAEGGKKGIENGAILQANTSHPYLHLIEYVDIDTYIELNSIFKIVNMQGKEPTLMQRGVIEDLLLRFEEEHRWDKGRDGELLIKRKYLKRW